MILYNNNFYPEERHSPEYPSWVKCENYEQCEEFIAEYSSVKSRSDLWLSRKAVSFLKALRRLIPARNRGKDAGALDSSERHA